jgi:hypothetical protein
MAITFTKLLDDTMYMLGYEGPGEGIPENTWNRQLQIKEWAKQALLAFPILRPRVYGFTLIGSTHNIELPADFKQMMSVEYPASQEPPQFLIRRSHLDPGFYTTKQTCYDVDRNYANGVGHVMIVSKLLIAGDHLHINYLAPHEIELEDNDTDEITVRDEYEEILILYIITRCYRELMTTYAIDPSMHENVITELTEMINQAEGRYMGMIKNLLTSTTAGSSAITPNRAVDKFDRVY